METFYREKLAKFILTILVIALIATICWFLRMVLLFIILAAVLALIAHPLFKQLMKIRVGKFHMPDALAGILSIASVFGIITVVLLIVTPVIGHVIGDISTANIENLSHTVALPLQGVNSLIFEYFPQVGSDFRIEAVVLEQLKSVYDTSSISSMVGSLTSLIALIGVTLFATVFISFFFVRKPQIIRMMFTSLVPDKYEKLMSESLDEIGNLISRYFVGLALDILGVSTLYFLGFLLVAKMGFGYSIGIAFLMGFLNIIPYIGPLMGCVLGLSLSLTIKYICVTSFGAAVGLGPFVGIILGIFAVTQCIDAYLFQPFIYSNSIKAHPLEIFLVLIIASQVGGLIGIVSAIPSYTVLRVIARKFFSSYKAVQRLTIKE